MNKNLVYSNPCIFNVSKSLTCKLPIFYSIADCDSIASFAGIGKEETFKALSEKQMINQKT